MAQPQQVVDPNVNPPPTEQELLEYRVTMDRLTSTFHEEVQVRGVNAYTKLIHDLKITVCKFKGNRYALTAICMLRGFTFCIPLKSKRAEDVVTAYLNHICCIFGPSKKILTDNGSEFKNKMWDEVFK